MISFSFPLHHSLPAWTQQPFSHLHQCWNRTAAKKNMVDWNSGGNNGQSRAINIQENAPKQWNEDERGCFQRPTGLDLSYLCLYWGKQRQEDKGKHLWQGRWCKIGKVPGSTSFEFHEKEPNAQEVLFLDTASELTWREVWHLLSHFHHFLQHLELTSRALI